MEVKQQFQ